MAQNVYVIGSGPLKEASEYANGQIVKVHPGGSYDVRLSNGQVTTYVENVSSTVYSVGSYVSILITGVAGGRGLRIIGSGRKMTNPSAIPVVDIGAGNITLGRN